MYYRLVGYASVAAGAATLLLTTHAPLLALAGGLLAWRFTRAARHAPAVRLRRP